MSFIKQDSAGSDRSLLAMIVKKSLSFIWILKLRILPIFQRS
jgi:hypothetical protein